MVASILPPSFEKQTPPFRVEPDGTVRIGNSRITLDMVVEAYHLGETPESFAADYETVTPAEIYATIGYYLSYREQIDAYLKKREDEAQRLRKIFEADPRHQALTEKFRRIKAERKGAAK